MLATSSSSDLTIVAITDKPFYIQLGQRIADARKAQGLTQVQLADTLGIAQQTLAHYEGGKLRVAASLLPQLAQTLGISIEDLVGTSTKGAGKRGPAPQLQQKLERLSRLPKAQQKVVMQMLDGMLSQVAHR